MVVCLAVSTPKNGAITQKKARQDTRVGATSSPMTRANSMLFGDLVERRGNPWGDAKSQVLEHVDGVNEAHEELLLSQEESFNSPSISPGQKLPTSSVRRIPRLVMHNPPTPPSLINHPRKKMASSSVDNASYIEELSDDFNGIEEKAQAKKEEAKNIDPCKFYVEIELPDGRLAHQCHASEDCPSRLAFLFKRLRMMTHLKESHGIDIEIPKRPGGRPLHKEVERRANLLPNLEVKAWKKAAMKRFTDKDWKFKQNCKRYQRLMCIRALQSMPEGAWWTVQGDGSSFLC
ncbi:hypothetical protein GOP47_0018431 [Adiantum capillus-veneris]|uniref:Uncharacterized protein n=1 Tax=Adiantum capillus-veneris TaxID=13818 RepID=A0A9D4UDM9_ADICA|nr:hypothetical protein GOP47_0018431 [Adiantum capillus-veneris]